MTEKPHTDRGRNKIHGLREKSSLKIHDAIQARSVISLPSAQESMDSPMPDYLTPSVTNQTTLINMTLNPAYSPKITANDILIHLRVRNFNFNLFFVFILISGHHLF